jgi:hypothetical protein
VTWLSAMKPNTVAGPRPICTALPHFPCLLNVQISVRCVVRSVNQTCASQRDASAVFPIGFALFAESAEALLGIFQTIEFVEKNVHGITEPIAKRKAHAAEDRFFGHGKDRTGVAGDAGAEIVDGGFELRLRHKAIDDAEIESAFRSDGLAEKNKFKCYLWTHEKRKNGGGERRKDAQRDFGLREASSGRGDDQIAKRGEFRAAADGRAVYDTDDGLSGFQNAHEDRVERIEHLKNALRCIFTDVNTATENLAGGIEEDELHVWPLARVSNAVDQFAEHVFVEKIVLGAIEGHACHAGFDMKFYGLEIGRVAAGGFGANLDVAVGQGCAACFHGGFSFGNRSKADGSMRGWERSGWAVAWCAKSLLAEETGGTAAGSLDREWEEGE